MGKPKRDILFTFDYELYLGVRSGTVNECLIVPTNRILAILSKYSIKAVFFIDTTYLIRLEEVKERSHQAKADWVKITDQLQSIFLQGHAVFPHLHPHWLDARYNEESMEWSLSDFSKYRFNSISNKEKDFLWERSVQIMTNITRSLDPEYKFDGYRAGGWCIQPFNDFKPYFKQYGIRHEFSVKPGYKLVSTAHQYDFLNAPQKNVYTFEDDILVEDTKGSYRQYTISSVKKITGIYKFIDKVVYKILLINGLKGYGNGLTIASSEIRNEARNIEYEGMEMASVENISLANLVGYVKFIRQNTYMQFLSHPKLINEYQLFCWRLFLKYIRTFYLVNTDFRKIETK